MRVELNPAGGVLIGLSLCVIVAVAVMNGCKQETPPAVVATKPPSPGAASTPPVGATAIAYGKNLLVNPGFEKKFKTISGSGVATGKLAEGWYDATKRVNLSVRYGSEAKMIQEGKQSQRIEILNYKGGQAQIAAQGMMVPAGTRLRATVQVRSSKPAKIQVVLRDGPGNVYFGTVARNIGPAWDRSELTATVKPGGVVILAIILQDPATFWIDDARLEALR